MVAQGGGGAELRNRKKSAKSKYAQKALRCEGGGEGGTPFGQFTKVRIKTRLPGREFGEEGVMFMEVACEKMGCPLDVVLQELAEAPSHGPEQPPPEL